MPNSFQEWMNELNRFAKDAHHKGMLFERFMVAYLKTDPVYADKLDAVWQYKDWPDRPEHWNADNLGFDLVARTIDGDYWAIQCKFYDEKSRIHKDAITNFTHDFVRKPARKGRNPVPGQGIDSSDQKSINIKEGKELRSMG